MPLPHTVAPMPLPYTVTRLRRLILGVLILGSAPLFLQSTPLAAAAASSVQTRGASRCLSPYTRLNICRLRKGDILLEASNVTRIRLIPFMPSRDLLSTIGTYFFHIGLYDGAGRVLEARGPDAAHPDREVRDTPLRQTSFYGAGQGTDAIDWVVLRLKPAYQHTINGAVAWAIERANNPGVRFMGETSWQQLLTFLNPLNKSQDWRFYCSLYVWRAFDRQGLDLDFNGPIPVSGATWLTWQQVRPDDIYASALGPYAVTSVVQDKYAGWPRLRLFLTNYELAVTYLEASFYRPFSWLIALAGVVGARLCYRRLRRRRLLREQVDAARSGPERGYEPAGRLDVAR